MKKLFIFPFSRQYWALATKDSRDLKKLTICALMIALNIIVSTPMFNIPVSENLKITFGYFVTALNSAIVGPALALVYGFVLDNVSFMVFPSGSYFFGYTLSSMAGAIVYALFLYRTKISVLRIALAKLTVNLFVNVLMGSIWSTMLFSKGFIFYVSASFIKNMTLLPFEVMILTVVFKAIVPYLYRRKLIDVNKVEWL